MSDHIPIPSSMLPDVCIACGTAIDEHTPMDVQLIETATVERSYLLGLENKLERIETICRTTQKDTSEVRWVRMFAGEILKVIADERD